MSFPIYLLDNFAPYGLNLKRRADIKSALTQLSHLKNEPHRLENDDLHQSPNS